MVNVPVGVPGFPLPRPPPLPPPQPVPAIANTASRTENVAPARNRREGIPSRNTPANTNPTVVSPQCCNAAEGAIVDTVKVVVPLPVTDAGLKLQLAPKGKPPHDAELKLT